MAARTISWAFLAILFAFALSAIPLAWTAAALGGEEKVRITNFTFDPPVLKVKAGTAVAWFNEDDIPHTIASADRAFKSKALDTGDKYTFTFTAPGTYAYFCSLHPHMTAKIIVEGTASQR
jgi:plastocyanin